jgi:DNA-directed RNA polymerase subunit RPC12/RpoP
MRKMFCARCHREYFSAARLEHLTNKACECGGKLIETKEQDKEPERKDDHNGDQRC